jgi:hypothetical protein
MFSWTFSLAGTGRGVQRPAAAPRYGLASQILGVAGDRKVTTSARKIPGAGGRGVGMRANLPRNRRKTLQSPRLYLIEFAFL